MTLELNNQPFNHPSEPLPVVFSAAERRIDSLLREQALHQPLAADLADRIYRASRAELPRQTLRLQPAAAKQSAALLWSKRSTMWSRLALAASLALAFCVCITLMNSGRSTPSSNSVARISPSHRSPRTPTVAEIESLPASSIDEIDTRMGYLLETDDVKSFEQMRSELNTLIASLEQ